MSELDVIVSTLNELASGGFPAVVASRAAAHIQTALQTSLAAGETPTGQKWVAKKDGGRAYQNAASKITTKSFSNVVRVVLTGPEVYGHYGKNSKGHGMPERRMLPDTGADIPAIITDAITLGAREAIAGVVR